MSHLKCPNPKCPNPKCSNPKCPNPKCANPQCLHFFQSHAMVFPPNLKVSFAQSKTLDWHPNRRELILAPPKKKQNIMLWTQNVSHRKGEHKTSWWPYEGLQVKLNRTDLQDAPDLQSSLHTLQLFIGFLRFFFARSCIHVLPVSSSQEDPSGSSWKTVMKFQNNKVTKNYISPKHFF